MKLLAVLLYSVALSAAQFTYSQQFGGGQAAPRRVKDLENTRTFRLSQVHLRPVAAAVPIQQEIQFPDQPESIVAPIPVARAIENTSSPVVEVSNTAEILQVNESPEKFIAQPRPVAKRVRVIKEKARAVPVQAAPQTLINENRSSALAEADRLRRDEEAKNAHYSFSSSVQDSINDHAITRSESRDGLALTGMYSYSDGFFKRTVHYMADQDGYRVVK